MIVGQLFRQSRLPCAHEQQRFLSSSRLVILKWVAVRVGDSHFPVFCDALPTGRGFWFGQLVNTSLAEWANGSVVFLVFRHGYERVGLERFGKFFSLLVRIKNLIKPFNMPFSNNLPPTFEMPHNGVFRTNPLVEFLFVERDRLQRSRRWCRTWLSATISEWEERKGGKKIIVSSPQQKIQLLLW
jgi:hypothetical protein